MIIISLEQILELHALVIKETGGSAGLRDLGRLEAAIATQTQNVFGEELYPDTFDKAGALLRGIVGDHAFIDGNKRTGMLACITLLRLNKINFKAEKGEVEDFALRVTLDHLDVPDISRWLREHI